MWGEVTEYKKVNLNKINILGSKLGKFPTCFFHVHFSKDWRNVKLNKINGIGSKFQLVELALLQNNVTNQIGFAQLWFRNGT